MIGISPQRKLNVRSRARGRVTASKIDRLLWAECADCSLPHKRSGAWGQLNAKITLRLFELEPKNSPGSVSGAFKRLNLLVNGDDSLDMLILSEAALI